MKRFSILIGILAIAIICSQGSQAYSYWQGNYQTIHPSYDRPYFASAYNGGYTSGYTSARTNQYYVYDGHSNYGARYIGGIYPTYYRPQRPVGYQGGQFNSGPDYGKMYAPRSMSWYYGRGNSDYFYDGYYRRYSQYYMYD